MAERQMKLSEFHTHLRNLEEGYRLYGEILVGYMMKQQDLKFTVDVEMLEAAGFSGNAEPEAAAAASGTAAADARPSAGASDGALPIFRMKSTDPVGDSGPPCVPGFNCDGSSVSIQEYCRILILATENAQRCIEKIGQGLDTDETVSFIPSSAPNETMGRLLPTWRP